MSYLFENPFLILVVGTLLIAACGYVYLNTRQKGAVTGLVVVVALTAIALLVEHLVETPREQVETSLNDLAHELEANNVEGALKYLAPSAKETRDRARWAMSRFQVTKAKVSDLRITVNETMSPPSAEVKFTGVIGVVDRKGVYPATQSVPVKFTAKLRQQNDRWVVTEHTDDAIGVQ